jgi:hypothetical protein
MVSNSAKAEGLQSAYDTYLEKIFLIYIEALAGGENVDIATSNFKKALDLGTKTLETAQQLLGL